MTMKAEEISRLRAAFTAPEAIPVAWSPGSCPEPDRIWEAVRGELRPEEVREIVDHMAVCASCAEDWRIAVAFKKESEAGEQVQRPAVVRRFPARVPYRPWIAAAAAALVLTVGGVTVREMLKPGPTAEFRGGESKVHALVPPGGVLPREAFVLSWKPVEDAESYELLVTTTELVIVADPKGLTTTQYQVPASALAGLPAGTQLHWSVTAVFPDGGLRSSEMVRTMLE